MPAALEPTREPVLLLREMHADEEYVVNAFERHAGHCLRCAAPLDTLRAGDSLCERGLSYAADVAQYLYSKQGKAYSVIARERHQPTLVKIPRDCPAVRNLLLAIEDGLRLHRASVRFAPVVSHEKKTHTHTYRVSSRSPVRLPSPPASPATSSISTFSASSPSQRHEIIEREPRSSQPSRVVVYPSPQASPSRGSLYERDAVERIERFHTPSRIRRTTEYYR
ncbi:hypothetical protein ASPZODRAFT_135385 [Penicilliopsis zonata CBS 506.65]|uniref:Uncharacterized protein n=1 Tax=Penicilliopsis zonata CBS 506.65 TaxID=1073090 RepID=A0A1L9SA29_9EURO|nr:hypothetical protein ASPZODRAFT_135385 [Penicilliopsis zonata CBS 506.65]OJJ43967.1 hypothetical protein ASPZODRAFT_135385 [Penicilliopsis zonata CBS 506.65]